MDVRNQSEVKHDLDSRLTPVKYDDLHRGESFTRQQTDFVPRHQYASPSPFRTDRNQPTRYQPTKPSLAVLHTYPNNSYQDDEDDNSSIYEHSEDNEEDLSFAYVDTQTNPPDSTDPEYQTHYKPTLLSMGDVRSTFRFANGILGKGVNYTTTMTTETSVSLRLVSGSLWRKNVETTNYQTYIMATMEGKISW